MADGGQEEARRRETAVAGVVVGAGGTEGLRGELTV